MSLSDTECILNMSIKQKLKKEKLKHRLLRIELERENNALYNKLKRTEYLYSVSDNKLLKIKTKLKKIYIKQNLKKYL